MWVDILTTAEAKTSPAIDIKPPRKTPFEIRLIVWKSRGFSLKDRFLKQSDVFVKGFLGDSGQAQCTDVHFGAKKEAELNWRMKFTAELPAERGRDSSRLHLQLWDKDIFSFDVFRFSANKIVPFNIFKKVFSYFLKFWINFELFFLV